MLIQSLFYVPTILTLLIIAAVVFLKDRGSLVNRLFSGFLLLASIWLIFLYAQDISTSANTALAYMRLVSVINPMLAFSYLLFVIHFPFKDTVRFWIYVLAFVPAVFFSLTSYSSDNFSGADISGIVALPINTGYIYELYFVYNLVYFGLASFILLTKVKHATLDQKFRIKLVATATLLAITVSIAYIVLPHMISSNSVLQLLYLPSILVAVLIILPAMLSSRIFNPRSTMSGAVIEMEKYMNRRKGVSPNLYMLQTDVHESSSSHIALDFSGVEEIDEQTMLFLLNLRKQMKEEKKKLYFIRRQPRVMGVMERAQGRNQ